MIRKDLALNTCCQWSFPLGGDRKGFLNRSRCFTITLPAVHPLESLWARLGQSAWNLRTQKRWFWNMVFFSSQNIFVAKTFLLLHFTVHDWEALNVVTQVSDSTVGNFQAHAPVVNELLGKEVTSRNASPLSTIASYSQGRSYRLIIKTVLPCSLDGQQ